MEKVKLAIVVMVLAVVTGCASDPTKHSYAMNVMKSLEFDEGLRDQEIPPGEYAKLKEVRVTRPGDSIETATSTAALTGAAGVAYMAGGLSWGTFGSGGIALTSLFDLLKVDFVPASSSFVAFVGDKGKYGSEEDFKASVIPVMTSVLNESLHELGYQPQLSRLPTLSSEERRKFKVPPRLSQNGYTAFKVSVPYACKSCYVVSMGLVQTKYGDSAHNGPPMREADFPSDSSNLAASTPSYVAFATPYLAYHEAKTFPESRELLARFKTEILAALASRAPSNMLIYIAPQTYPNQPAPYIIYQNKIHFFAKEVASK